VHDYDTHSINKTQRKLPKFYIINLTMLLCR